MKKNIYMLTLLLLGITAMGAGLSQLTISISTEGPDYYADGTAVQVGETYLLVYVNEGATFAGVKTDGTLVDAENNEIVTEAQAVAGSKCGFKAIQYPPEMYPEGGQFLIVLLDSRNATGAVGGLVAQVGVSEGEEVPAADSPKLTSVSVAATTGEDDPALVADTQTTVPSDTPAPVISKIEGKGDDVDLTIENVSATANYQVQTKTDLMSGQWVNIGSDRLQLDLAGQTEIPATVEVPQNDKVRFFRVVVPGSN